MQCSAVSVECLLLYLCCVVMCGFAAHTDVGPGFDSTSLAKSRCRLASHRAGNLTRKTEKSDTVGAFDKAGFVDTICILLDVDSTA